MVQTRPGRDIVVTPTTSEVRSALRRHGFIHVTGLEMVGIDQRRSYIEPEAKHFGRWDHNNGRLVVYTIGGECWLRYGGKISDAVQEIVRDLCPNGEGAFVPCSNGEQLFSGEWLTRLADDKWWPGDDRG